MIGNVPKGANQARTYALLLAVLWSLVIAASLAATLVAQRKEKVAIARNVARAYIEKDLLFREWVAQHGGAYVQVTGETPPNPFMPKTQREVTTSTGERLTLVNPAYLTRQLYDLAQRQKHVSARITSLNPLSPHNAADSWEDRVLHRFEQGEEEVGEVVAAPGGRSFRLMRRLMTEESCLACHSRQGYRGGEVRGGISIELPMALFEPETGSRTGLLWAGHGAIWLLGLTGGQIGYRRIRRRTYERDRAEEELRRVNRLLKDQATTDFLTATANRRRFLELLQGALCEAARYGRSFAVIFLDVDRFKAINDTFGHEAGDAVLREIAGTVGSAIRQTDILGRYGGEEFVIVAHNNDLRTGAELAEKIRLCVERHLFPCVGRVTCSFGVAGYVAGDTVESLLARADAAMYAAKRGGRNRVCARAVSDEQADLGSSSAGPLSPPLEKGI